MSTDAGSAAAPEDTATREVASERPGLESADPGSADSATSTPQTADRGVEGSAGPDGDDRRLDGSRSRTRAQATSEARGVVRRRRVRRFRVRRRCVRRFRVG